MKLSAFKVTVFVFFNESIVLAKLSSVTKLVTLN